MRGNVAVHAHAAPKVSAGIKSCRSPHAADEPHLDSAVQRGAEQLVGALPECETADRVLVPRKALQPLPDLSSHALKCTHPHDTEASLIGSASRSRCCFDGMSLVGDCNTA